MRCHEGGGVGLAHDPWVAEVNGPPTLVQHRMSARQHVLQPVRLRAVADENGVAIMGFEHQKGRSISPPRFPPDVFERPEVRKPRCDRARRRVGDALVELCDLSRHAHARSLGIGRSGCPQSDSNRHLADFKSAASANWAMGASPLRGYFMRLGRSPDDSTGDYAHMARRPVPRVLGHVRADVSDRKMGKASETLQIITA